MTDIWEEKPELVDASWYDLTGENHPNSDRYYANKEDYEEAMGAWLEKLKVDYDLQYERSMRWLHFLMHGEYTPKQVSEWKEKAERWDKYLESIKDSIPHISLADYEILEDKLEAIKTYTEREFKAGYLIKPIDILKILEGEE